MPFAMLTKFFVFLLGIITGLWWLDSFDEGVIEGKRVLVTGASTGIGEQIAYQFARMGASVMVTARRKQRLEEVVTKCRELGIPGATFDYIPADMADLDFTKTLVEKSAERMGGLDYLVLNHILPHQFRFWNGTDKDFDHLNMIFEVNFKAYVHLATHAIPFLDKSDGRIIVISSFAGKVSLPFKLPYAATKFAVGGFFNGLRQELKLKGSRISVTLCTLGFINTERAVTALLGLGRSSILQDVARNGASATDTASAIIKSGTNRQRDLYYPFIQTYPYIKIGSLFPSLVDYIMRYIYGG